MKRLALIVAHLVTFTISCTATSTPTSVPTVAPQATVTTKVVMATPQVVTVTAAPEPTNTPTRTTTSTPSPTFTISGIVFFDRNGNGIQDPGEFPIGTVEVVVQDTGGKEQIVKTTGQGYYEFRGLRTGTYRVKVNETGTAQAFRYILTSNSSSLPIKQGISVQVTKDTPLSLPLAQGLFVSPACGQIMGWFDHASATGSVMNHIGDGTRFQTPSKPFVSISEVKAGTYDQHFGIDFYGDEGTPVVAVAPGTVMTTRTADNGALEVRINHGQADFAPGFEMHSFYGHLLDFAVKPGQKVERGQLIGHVGVSGASWYHLHFYVVLNGRKDSEDLFVYIDPFGITFKSQQDESDMVRPDGGRPEHRVMSYRQVSLWTVYNDPQCTVGK